MNRIELLENITTLMNGAITKYNITPKSTAAKSRLRAYINGLINMADNIGIIITIKYEEPTITSNISECEIRIPKEWGE